MLGRGELQLSILLEMMRREGYELMVGKPEIVTKRIDGKLMEPVEYLTVDIPEEFVGVVMEQFGSRQRRSQKHAQSWIWASTHRISRSQPGPDWIAQPGADRYARHNRDEFPLPRLHRMARRDSAPADRSADCRSRWAHDFARAIQLARTWRVVHWPGRGCVRRNDHWGKSKDNDLDVNVVREKKLTNMRASTADEAIRLVPFGN